MEDLLSLKNIISYTYKYNSCFVHDELVTKHECLFTKNLKLNTAVSLSKNASSSNKYLSNPV